MYGSNRWKWTRRFGAAVALLCLAAAATGGPAPFEHEIQRWSTALGTAPTLNPPSASPGESAWDINVNDIWAPVGWAGQGIGTLIYPANRTGASEYLAGAGLAFGCVRFPDTLVSGAWPGSGLYPVSGPWKRSPVPTSRFYDPATPADVEIYSVSSDTVWGQKDYDEIADQYVDPIGIEVHQTVRAWKKSLVGRALFVDDWVVNVSDQPLQKVVIGVAFSTTYEGWFNRHLWQMCEFGEGHYPPPQRSICGFVPAAPGILSSLQDSVNLAWCAEFDGKPKCSRGRFGPYNPTAAVGIRILRAPKGARVSFNWSNDSVGWGPRRREALADYPKDVTWPRSDRSLYQSMISGEIDYDQVYSAIDMTGQGWVPPCNPRDTAIEISEGLSHSSNALLSIGPLADWIPPGDSIHLTYAVVVGEDFHSDPHNFIDNFNPDDPSRFVNNLNFFDLITAAQWAGWFYDNPGVDTDHDGYKGEYVVTDCHLINCDTVYYTGDGVPDYKGPEPPPPPPFDISTYPTKLVVRWTGATTEYARDKHMRTFDWEGYKVWLAQDDTSRGYALLASWDREDYVRVSYRPNFDDWKQSSQPLNIAEWQEALGDPQFDPNRYVHPSVANSYNDTEVDTVRTPDGRIIGVTSKPRMSYFAAQDANYENTYPSQGRTAQNLIQQVGTMDTVIDGQVRQYGIYEFTMDKLSQTQAYWIAVTAFDYGDYRNHIDPEETTPAQNYQYFRAINSADVVVDSGLRVSVFPNPYKLLFRDWQGHWTSYHEQGHEIPKESTFDERDRRMWFINLPDTAIIQIYSLDGDLIREIRHPDTFLTHYNSAVGWDLISRNQQAVTSGIYIWRVTSRLGSQMGKLVIIK
jgi:hypothetical protein